MIYSEEMRNAIKYGYKFNIIRGYYFEKQENIFKKYIKELYQLRLTYDKDNPLNFIAKILMNSLYGRFGMNDNFSESGIMDKNKFNEYISKLIPQDLKLIDDMYEVGDNHMLVSKFFEPTDTMLNSLTQNHPLARLILLLHLQLLRWLEYICHNLKIIPILNYFTLILAQAIAYL